MDECLGHEPEDMIGCSYCEIESLKEQNRKLLRHLDEYNGLKFETERLLGGE